MDQNLRNIISLDWITLIIIGILIVLAILKFVYPKRFEDFFKLLYSDKFYTSSIKKYFLLQPFDLALMVIQWISIALFIYIGFCLFSGTSLGTKKEVFVYILGGYLVFEITKALINRVLGYLFNLNELSIFYNYRSISNKNWIAILLLFFSSLLGYYFKETIWLYQLMLVFGIVLLFISIGFTLSKIQSKIFARPSYFILYFCTLEIAPYYILYKLFI